MREHELANQPSCPLVLGCISQVCIDQVWLEAQAVASLEPLLQKMFSFFGKIRSRAVAKNGSIPHGKPSQTGNKANASE
jgi:hypothetical protein